MDLGQFSISRAVKDLQASRAFYEKHPQVQSQRGACDFDALLAQGVEILTKEEEAGSSPSQIVLNDPDGNPVLLDQHNP